jgi:hypothetical protein
MITVIDTYAEVRNGYLRNKCPESYWHKNTPGVKYIIQYATSRNVLKFCVAKWKLHLLVKNCVIVYLWETKRERGGGGREGRRM